MLVKREIYLKKLQQLQDKKIIKVISGVRRCGKSTLLNEFIHELKFQGVDSSQIQSYNFEEIKWQKPYTELNTLIEQKLSPRKMNYIFLDEIQNIASFEKLVDSLFAKKNTDVYITGSNAFLLSSELATLLTGRYFEIQVLPFSFGEYLEMTQEKNTEKAFTTFLQNGGFPQSVEMFDINESTGIEYLNSIYNSIIIKDIVPRISDSSALDLVAKFIQDNIGNQTSFNKISNAVSIDYRKAEKYTKALEMSFLIRSVNRYNLKGKEILKTGQKYYTIDQGLRRAILGQSADRDRGHVLENVVYLELLRRGYQVWSGQTKENTEVDFVTHSSTGETQYFQVCESMLDEKTRQRELASLQSISDNNPKIILTRDYDQYNYDGIKQVNVIDWLLDK